VHVRALVGHAVQLMVPFAAVVKPKPDWHAVIAVTVPFDATVHADAPGPHPTQLVTPADVVDKP